MAAAIKGFVPVGHLLLLLFLSPAAVSGGSPPGRKAKQIETRRTAWPREHLGSRLDTLFQLGPLMPLEPPATCPMPGARVISGKGPAACRSSSFGPRSG